MAKPPKPKVTAAEFARAQADPAYAKELAKKHGLLGGKAGLLSNLKRTGKSATTGLKSAVKGAKPAMGMLGMAMNAWLVYELGKMAGVFGAEGEQDASFMGAYEAGITPALQQQQQVASEMMGQRTETRQMEGMSRFAQKKQHVLEDTDAMLGRELDNLLAGKAGLLSKASLMPDTTAQALSHVVNTGLL